MRKTWLIYLVFFLWIDTAISAPANFTYQGQIVKPNGAPLEASNVIFTLEIYSPNAEQCLLYQERHTVNMMGSNGIFALQVGTGSRTGTDFEDTYSLANALSNTTGLVTPTTCSSVGTYTPASSHGRRMRVSFNDGSETVTLSQMHNIVSVPYATSASSIDGLNATDILTVNSAAGNNLDQANLEFVFNTTNWVELQALLDGSSASFSGGLPLADVDYNSQKIVNLADPAYANDATNKNYVDTNLGGTNLDSADLQALAVINAGEVLTWSGTQWVSQAPSTTDNTKLPLAGGTMIGALNMGGEDISNVNNLDVDNSISVTGGIGVGTGINSGGTISLTNGNELHLRDADDSNYVGFVSPALVASDIVWTLPATDGANGEVLQTNGAGILNWVALSSGNVASSRAINAGAGLSGGGDLSADRTINIDIPGQTDLGATANNADTLLIYDVSATALREVTRAQLNLSETEVDAMVANNGYAADADKVDITGDTMTGTLQMNTANEVRFMDGADTNYVGLKAAANVTTSVTWTLPLLDGANNEVLVTDGAGNLSFIAIPSAPVPTVFGRNGAIVAAIGDYDAVQIDNAATGNIAATDVQAAINELDSEKVGTDRTISTTAGSGLTGGGDLSANRSLAIDIPGQTDLGATADSADTLLIYDISATALREVTRAQLNLSEAEVDAMVADNGYAADADKVDITGDTMTGELIMGPTGAGAGAGGTISFKELFASAGDDYVGFRAPDNVTTSVIWQLPAADGASGQVLQTNGSGVLSWANSGGGADDLGDHTATTDLDMANNSILGVEAGNAAAPGISFHTDANTGIFSAGLDSMSFATAGNEVMTILSNGRIAIGTTSATSKMEVVSDSTPAIRLNRSSNTNDIKSSFNNYRSRADNTPPLAGFGAEFEFNLEGFTNGSSPTAASIVSAWEQNQTNNTTDRDSYLSLRVMEDANNYEAIRISSSGSVGIGTTNPSGGLEIYGKGGNDLVVTTTGVEHANLLIQSANNSTSEVKLREDTTDQYGANLNYDGANNRFNLQRVTSGVATSVLTFLRDSDAVGIFDNNPDASLEVSGTFMVSSAAANDGDRFLVNSSGNVGIGTTAPTEALGIERNGRAGIDLVSISDSDGSRIFGARARGSPGSETAVASGGILLSLEAYGYNGSAWSSGERAAVEMRASQNWTTANNGAYVLFKTTPDNSTTTAERMRITDSGNVGIGTTDPNDKLQVAGDIRVGTGSTGCVKDADGTVIAGTCSSDMRFKTDIEPLGRRLEQVSQLRPVTYKWRSEEFPDKHFGHETETGLVAQEVQQVIPELVAEDEEGYLKVRFTELNIYILQAIKDLYNRILGIESHQTNQDRQIASKADKTEIEALKAKNQKLEQENAAKAKELEKVKARLDKIEKMLNSK